MCLKSSPVCSSCVHNVRRTDTNELSLRKKILRILLFWIFRKKNYYVTSIFSVEGSKQLLDTIVLLVRSPCYFQKNLWKIQKALSFTKQKQRAILGEYNSSALLSDHDACSSIFLVLGCSSVRASGGAAATTTTAGTWNLLHFWVWWYMKKKNIYFELQNLWSRINSNVTWSRMPA